MRRFSLLAAAGLLTACPFQPDTLGGFTLYPGLPTAPAQGLPGLEFTADGTLWLTYVENHRAAEFGIRPARLGAGGWELQPRRDGILAGFLLGQSEGSLVMRLVMMPPYLEGYGEVRRYGGGAWSEPIFDPAIDSPGSTVYAVGPAGRILAVYSPASDAQAQLYTPGTGVAALGDRIASAEQLMNVTQKVAAFLPTGEPVVAFGAPGETSATLWVVKWDGASWVSAADPLTVDATSWGFKFHLLADSQSRLWAVVRQTHDAALPAVWRWSGTAWERLDAGPAPAATGDSDWPETRVAARVDAEDRLLLLIGVGRTIDLHRLGPDGPEVLGPALEDDAMIFDETLAIAPDGTIAVAWNRREGGFFSGGPGSTTIRVARYTGNE